jgi:hypothetical protein
VHIPNQPEQVDVRIDQQSGISLLEKVSPLPRLAVSLARVLAREALHDPPQRQICDLKYQMNCGALPAIRMRTRAAAGKHGRKQRFERRVVCRALEYGLARAAALDDVVDAARHMEPGSA